MKLETFQTFDQGDVWTKDKKSIRKKKKMNNVEFNSIQGKVKICHRLTKRKTLVGAGDATAARKPLLLNCVHF